MVVPEKAFLLDWVFADGPPQIAKVYDNNLGRDFHAIVPKGVPDDQHWAEVEEQIYKKLWEERRTREEAERLKVKRSIFAT